MHTYRTIYFFLTFLLLLIFVPKAHAISCSPDPGGGYTISSSCTFPYTVDGVESGDMVINPGATLTINAGQTVVYNPGNKLTINGAMAISSTGKAYQGFIYVKDADADGYPDDNTSYSLTQTDGTWLRRYTMTSLSSSDCDTATANFQSIASLEADADNDGYTTGSAATRCVGGTSVVNGRTYYVDYAAAGAAKWLSTGARLGTSDCNDASSSVWRNRYADADADTYGASSATCVGNDAGYVDNNTDCSDSNAYIYQNVSVYTDSDQDGYVSAGPASTCVGSTSVVNGRTYYKNSAGAYLYVASTLGSDCYDSNANAYPSSSYSGTSNRGDGSFDYNCDGQLTQGGSCETGSGCSVSGTCNWCGGYSYYQSNHTDTGSTSCGASVSGACLVNVISYGCSTTYSDWRPPNYQGPVSTWCWAGAWGGIQSATWSSDAVPRTCDCK